MVAASLWLMPGLMHAQVRLSEYVLVSGPATSWTSIASQGTALSFDDNDDGTATCTLPFAMPFGTSTLPSGTQIACSSNGYLYLGETSATSTTASTSGHKVINAVLANDGHMARNSSSNAYYYYDAVDSTFTIQYTDLSTYSSPYGLFRYQIVMRPSGNITIIIDSVYPGYATNLRCYLSDNGTDNIALSGSWANPVQSSTISNMPTSPLPSHMEYNFYRVFGTCPAPSMFRYSNVTSDSCTLRWHETGQSSQWVIEYADSAFLPGCYQGNVVYASDTVYSLDNLQPNTTYHVYIHTDCGGDTSLNRYLSFTTACVPTQRTDLPMTENFERGGVDHCWKRFYVENGAIVDDTSRVYVTTSYAASGSHSLYLYTYYYNNITAAYAVLPMMEDSVEIGRAHV